MEEKSLYERLGGVFAIAAVEQAKQPVRIARMETDGGLVEHVQRQRPNQARGLGERQEVLRPDPADPAGRRIARTFPPS